MRCNQELGMCLPRNDLKGKRHALSPLPLSCWLDCRGNGRTQNVIWRLALLPPSVHFGLTELLSSPWIDCAASHHDVGTQWSFGWKFPPYPVSAQPISSWSCLGCLERSLFWPSWLMGGPALCCLLFTSVPRTGSGTWQVLEECLLSECIIDFHVWLHEPGT